MSNPIHTIDGLTKNQSLVMGALTKSESPLSAYTILDQLRSHGFRAPLQVYRALNKLVEFGMVHRLESLNAFVACTHTGCDAHGTLAFMICDTCNQVDEITDPSLTKRLKQLANEASFTLNNSTIELRGICSTCQPSQ